MCVKIKSRNDFDVIQKSKITEEVDSILEDEIEEAFGLDNLNKVVIDFNAHSNVLN